MKMTKITKIMKITLFKIIFLLFLYLNIEIIKCEDILNNKNKEIEQKWLENHEKLINKKEENIIKEENEEEYYLYYYENENQNENENQIDNLNSNSESNNQNNNENSNNQNNEDISISFDILDIEPYPQLILIEEIKKLSNCATRIEVINHIQQVFLIFFIFDIDIDILF